SRGWGRDMAQWLDSAPVPARRLHRRQHQCGFRPASLLFAGHAWHGGVDCSQWRPLRTPVLWRDGDIGVRVLGLLLRVGGISGVAIWNPRMRDRIRSLLA